MKEIKGLFLKQLKDEMWNNESTEKDYLNLKKLYEQADDKGKSRMDKGAYYYFNPDAEKKDAEIQDNESKEKNSLSENTSNLKSPIMTVAATLVILGLGQPIIAFAMPQMIRSEPEIMAILPIAFSSGVLIIGGVIAINQLKDSSQGDN